MAADKLAMRLYIEEQRRYHDELTSSSQSLRNKLTTYIGAILALLTFLYSKALDDKLSTQDRLFIPPELYGKLFYFFGLSLLLYALIRLIHGSRPGGAWEVALQSSDLKAIENKSEKDYLIKLKNDYDSARQFNLSQHNAKFEAIKDAFNPMLLGAIIMIVLRYFQ